MKKINILLLFLVIVSAVFAFYPQIARLYDKIDDLRLKAACETNNQFQDDTGITEESNLPNKINESGTVNYFKDDFSGYSQNSKLIEQFDDLDDLSINGGYQNEKLSSDNISGQGSLSLELTPINQDSSNILIKKSLSQPLDLSRWDESGALTMWMKIENRKGIPSIGLRIGDKDNNYRSYQVINNLQMDIPNNYDSNDIYPDVSFNPTSDKPAVWTDFWLNRGWNLLFWKINKSNYSDTGAIDTKNITWFEIIIQEENNLSSQEILLDNFRVADGFQKDANTLANNWYPPNNEPQNGIFDLDKIDNEKYGVKLINVSESQYPSNGNRGRMVLNYNTPLNFSLRTRFMLTNFPKNEQEKVNTWFRIAYDFDSSNSVGHDWFGSFISFEWNKFGLTAVTPIEKDNIQEWEPKNENILGSSVDFTPRENAIYEIQLTVRGQNATASIYEVNNNCLINKGRVSFEFQRQPQEEKNQYPFCLEVTGNIKANIYDFEIKEL